MIQPMTKQIAKDGVLASALSKAPFSMDFGSLYSTEIDGAGVIGIVIRGIAAMDAADFKNVVRSTPGSVELLLSVVERAGIAWMPSPLQAVLTEEPKTTEMKAVQSELS